MEQKNKKVVNQNVMSIEYALSIKKADDNNAVGKTIDSMSEALNIKNIKTLKDATFSLATSFSLGEKKDFAECKILSIIRKKKLYTPEYKNFKEWVKACLDGRLSVSTANERAQIGDFISEDGTKSIFIKDGEKDFSYSALKVMVQGVVISELTEAVNSGKINPNMTIDEITKAVKYMKEGDRIDDGNEGDRIDDGNEGDRIDEGNEGDKIDEGNEGKTNTKKKADIITIKVSREEAVKWYEYLDCNKSKELDNLRVLIMELLK